MADRLLGLRVRIPSGGVDMSRVNVVCCEVRNSATNRSLAIESDQAQQPSTSTMKQVEEVRLRKNKGKKERNYVS